MTPEELVDELERRILGEATLTGAEVSGSSEADRAHAEQLWMGLGFAPVEPEDRVFTAADAEVIESLRMLRDLGIAGPEVTVPMTRVLGQALSRVAAAQVQAFRPRLLEAITEVDGPDSADEVLEAVTELLLPGFERFISYTWRRHLAAALRRGLLEDESEYDVVGFVDLVNYTRETRDLGDAELSDLLGRFQHIVYEQLTAAEGRVIKTLGDGVMFSVPTAAGAARAALGMVGACADDEVLTGVRVGLARGHVVAVEGDVFGETVNRASRLADEALPHTVLADDEVGEILTALGEVTVKRTKPHRLKGLGVVQTWVVRPPRL